MSVFSIYQNKTGNRVVNVYGKLNGDSETYYEAELFILGISQGMEAITKAQIKNRYPIFAGLDILVKVSKGA